jgi:Na+/pantothenate symporter
MSDASKRKASTIAIIGLGVLSWAVAYPNVGTLATVLFFAGPMVGSCIWPIVGGLYYRRPGPVAACASMVLGTTCGLWAYFAIGWFVASLIGATVSGLVFGFLTYLSPNHFEFASLNQEAG